VLLMELWFRKNEFRVLSFFCLLGSILLKIHAHFNYKFIVLLHCFAFIITLRHLVLLLFVFVVVRTIIKAESCQI